MNKSFSFVVIQSSSCCLRYDDVASVPPHPDPLPWGEGIACDASPHSEWQPSCDRQTVHEESRSMLPLPKGEGWGEGEQHVRSRCASNVQIRFPHPAKMWVMTRDSSPAKAPKQTRAQRRLTILELRSVISIVGPRRNSDAFNITAPTSPGRSDSSFQRCSCP